MPAVTGIELLTYAHDCHPRAKRCLLLSYGESELRASPVTGGAISSRE
jgi:hypothetical protein